MGAFPLGEPAHQFMTQALAQPLSEALNAEERVLGQVERAVNETLEHHAHVRLMPATSRRSSRPALREEQPQSLPQSAV